MPVMHQAVKAFLANQRQGNAATKIRKFVTGGNQKPWKQKGTGRARQGSTRAPHWRGRRHGVRPDAARLPHRDVPRKVRAARPEERAQRAGARGRDLRDRALRLRRAEDGAARGAARRASGVDGQEGADPDRRREAERVPERPEPADRARACRTPTRRPTTSSGRTSCWSRRARSGVMPEPLPDEPEAEERARRRKAKPAKPRQGGEAAPRRRPRRPRPRRRRPRRPRRPPPRRRPRSAAKKPAPRSRAEEEGEVSDADAASHPSSGR